MKPLFLSVPGLAAALLISPGVSARDAQEADTIKAAATADEAASGEKIICTQYMSVTSRIPKQRCSTAAEREAARKAQAWADRFHFVPPGSLSTCGSEGRC